ncbi:hypothetical protein Tco_0526270 [Tanacetum coccineum]
MTSPHLSNLKCPPVAPKADRRKDIAPDDTKSPKKLVKASTIVRPDLDEPIRVLYEIHGKMYQLRNNEIQTHLDKEEKIKKAAEEANLLAMSKPELIKVPKCYMKKPQIKYSQKVKKAMKLKMKSLDQYMWTTTSKLKPEPITNVKIHAKTKPMVITIYRGTNRRIDAFKEKKNKIVGELMTSLGKRYERLNKIPEELGIQSALPAPAQAQSQSSGRKRKHMKLEPKIRIPSLECNRSLPKGVSFVNNMVIEEPEYGMSFIDIFGDEAFKRMNDIHKVDIETIPTYLFGDFGITELDELGPIIEKKKNKIVGELMKYVFKNSISRISSLELSGRRSCGDYGEEVVLLQNYLTEILGFLEKFGGGFEEDMMSKEWEEIALVIKIELEAIQTLFSDVVDDCVGMN